MTTFSAAAVSNAAIAFQKPITLQQGRALRDNLAASFEGSPGAHRLQGAAHPDFSVGGVVVDYLSLIGDDIGISGNAGGGGPGTSFQTFYMFTAIKAGTLALSFDLKATTAQTARLAVFVNGVMAFEETTTSTSYVAKTNGFTYPTGAQVYIRGGIDYTNAGGTAYARNVTLLGNARGTYRT